MAEEHVNAFLVQPSDHTRKLEDLESEVVLEQHSCSIHPSKSTLGEKQVDKSIKRGFFQSPVLKKYLVDATNSNDDSTSASIMTQRNTEEEDWLYSGIALDGKNQKPLEGISMLFAEDTPFLQRVATIMLEKMGATVTAVGDGQQALDSLNYESMNAPDPIQEQKLSDKETINNVNSSTYDLILMDCQMPKMDGYEATKVIRRAEIGTELHIPNCSIDSGW